MYKTKPIQISLKDLFQALPESIMYITKEQFANYHHGWKFKPLYNIDTTLRERWHGDMFLYSVLHPNSSFLEDNKIGDYSEQEMPKHLAGCAFAQSIWEVKEFVDKPIKECIAYRGDYE